MDTPFEKDVEIPFVEAAKNFDVAEETPETTNEVSTSENIPTEQPIENNGAKPYYKGLQKVFDDGSKFTITNENEDGTFNAEFYDTESNKTETLSNLTPEELQNTYNVQPASTIPTETKETPSTDQTPTPEQQAEADKQAFLQNLPIVEKGARAGQIDQKQMTPEQTIQYFEYTFGKEKTAAAAETQLKNLQTQLKREQDKLSKNPFDIAQNEKVDQIEKELAVYSDYMNKVKTEKLNQNAQNSQAAKEVPTISEEERKRNAEEARRKAQAEQEALNGVPDVTTDTAEKARIRGFRSQNGVRIERQAKMPIEHFTEQERKFSDKDKVPVKRTIVELETVQPSHKGGVRNMKYFITEAQPKERTDDASAAASSRIARNINPEEITGGVTAYTGAPILNDRREIIQGNNRFNGLEEMYYVFPENAKKYIKYLMEHASEYGMTPEQVAAMNNPAAVDIAEVDDNEAIRLGQLNASDTESGGYQRIAPQQTSVGLGKDIGRFSQLLFENNSSEDMTMSDVFDQNGKKAISYLAQKGLINETQQQSAFDKRGNLTPEAKKDLQDIASFVLFNGANDNMQIMFSQLPDKAKRAILQTIYRDNNSDEQDSIIIELRDAIEAYYMLLQDSDFVNATNKNQVRALVLKAARNQTTMFNTESALPFQKYSNFALELAIRFKTETQKELRARFNGLYDSLQGTGGDMFNESEKLNLADAIKKYFNVENYVPIRQNERSTVDGHSIGSQERQRGIADNTASREPSTQGEQSAERGGRTAADSGTEKPTEIVDKQEQVKPTPNQSSIDKEIAKQGVDVNPTEAEKAIDDLQARTNNDTKVVFVDSGAELPESIRNSKEYDENKFDAVFDGKNTIYMHRGKITTADEAIKVWVHEIGIHKGIRGIVQDKAQQKQLFERVYDSFESLASNDAEVKTVFDQVKRLYQNSNKAEQGEEMLAYLAEKRFNGEQLTTTEQTLWDKIVEIVKEVINKVTGRNELLTNDEINEIIQASVKSQINNKPTQEENTVPSGELNFNGNIAEHAEKTVIKNNTHINENKIEDKDINNNNDYGSNNTFVTKDRYEELKRRMKGKLNNLNVGFDPEVFSIGAEMAAYHIEAGARKFTEYAKNMINDLGDGIRPYLKSFYEGARTFPDFDNNGMDEYAYVKDFDIENYKLNENDNSTQKINTKNITNQKQLSIFDDELITNNTDENVRTLQANSNRLPKEEQAGTLQVIQERRSIGRDSNKQSRNVSEFHEGQQRSGIGEGDILPRHADVLIDDEPALVPFQIERNDTESFNKTVKYNDNISAIETLLKIIREDRRATPDEKSILSKYVGFGGLKEVLLDPKIDGVWDNNTQKYRQYISRIIELSNEFDNLTNSTNTFQNIRGSILNAHFTSSTVINAIYKGLDKIGFKGGNILEPSAGIGNFITYMPSIVKGKSNITAVELDKLTGSILKLIHDDINVKISGIENANIPNNSQDIVISNIPFGTYKVYDRTFKGEKEQFQNKIHNYFFVKALDQVREGGIIAFVTSKGVLDSPGNEALRIYIKNNAEFLGAVRLPDNAFEKTANTKVVTDIIFLKKTSIPNNTFDFVSTEEVDAIHRDGTPIKVNVNKYFIDNRQNMLGDIEAGGMYSRNDYTLKPNNTSSNLDEAIRRALPSNIYTTVNSAVGMQANDIIEKIDGVKEGNILYHNGILYQKKDGESLEIQINEPEEKINDYINLRNTLMNLIYSEYLNEDKSTIDDFRNKLNIQYDSFVKKYGKLDSSLKRISKYDADGFNVLSLENDGEKADIFSKRTINPLVIKTNADNINDAILISLSERASIDMERIAELLNTTIDDVKEKSRGEIFELPKGGYVTRDEYLSGNVKQKLEEAKKAVEHEFYEFQINVDELERVIPADIPAIQIEARLGSRWIPETVYTEFARFSLNNQNIKISYSQATDQYFHNGRVDTIEATQKFGTSRINGADVLLDALHLSPPTVYDTIKVNYGYTTADKRVVNVEETEKANQKYKEIRDLFEDWVYKSPDRRQLLSGIYNERFNNTVNRKYDGSHLTVPGLTNVKLRPHQKNAIWMLLQNNGGIIDHIVGSGKTYIMVSSTMEMKRTGVAKKPMIIALKSTIPQIIESYHKAYPMAKILAPTESDFKKENRQKLFSKIANNEWDCVIMSHENYGKIPHEIKIQEQLIDEELNSLQEERIVFELNNDKSALKGLEIRIKNLRARLENLNDMEKDNTLTFEQMGIDHLMVDESQQFKNLSYITKQRGIAGLGKAEGSKRSFNLLVGVRYLQQKYKMDKGVTFLSGTPITNSMVEMYSLLNYIRPNKMKQVGFTSFDAWATTFANPTTDIEFTVTGDIKQKTRFREFINTPELSKLYSEIADIQTDDTLHLDKPRMKGGGYTVENIKMDADQEEYAKNLMEFARTKDATLIGRPPLSKGEESAAMLLATNLSSKMAIDMRLINPKYEYNKNGKIARAVENISKIFFETGKYKGTQLIFSDLGTPKNKTNRTAMLRDYMEDELGTNVDTLNEIFGNQEIAGYKFPSIQTAKSKMIEVLEIDYNEANRIIEDSQQSTGSFDVYNEVKTRLIEKGVPEDQIVFIHDYNTSKKKEALFKKINNGDIRIILGSTQKLGTGVNVQERVVAVHHLDVPWTPAAMEQRNGRALRQGNKTAKNYFNNEIPVYTYATERTLDAYKYQLLQTKQRFITQIKSGNVTDRVIKEGEGDSDTGVGYAELVAMLSGNQDILTKSRLEERVNSLKRQKRNFEGDYYEAVEQKHKTEEKIPIVEHNISQTKQAVDEIRSKAKFDENGKLIIDKFNGEELKPIANEKGKIIKPEKTYYAKAAIEYIEKQMKKLDFGQGMKFSLGSFNFEFYVAQSNEKGLFSQEKKANISIVSHNGLRFSVNFSTIPGIFINNIQKTITDQFTNTLNSQQNLIERLKKDLEAYNEIIEKGDMWPKQNELNQLTNELEEVNKRLDSTTKRIEQDEVKFRKSSDDIYYSTVEQLLKTGLAKEVHMVTPEEIAGILEGNEQLHANFEVARMRNQQAESDRQYEKADELWKALNDAGFTDMTISRSITNFGVSTYVQGQYGLKYRISDHSVTNTNRVLDEIHFGFNTPIQPLVELAKIKKERIEARQAFVEEQLKAEKERAIAAMEKWQRIKSNFEGFVFKKNNRTYQDFATFSAAGSAPRSNVYQKVIGEGYGQKAFYYEWAEPTEYDKFGNATNYGNSVPSIEYIQAWDEGAGNVETTRFMRTPTGTIYGFVKGGIVYINRSTLNLNTPIHEFGHLWIDNIEVNHKALFEKGSELIKETIYWERVNSDLNYKDLSETARIKEAMAMAIGDNGERVVNDNGLKAKLKRWISDVWKRIGSAFGINNLKSEQISKLSFRDFVDIATSELLSGEKLTENELSNPFRRLDKAYEAKEYEQKQEISIREALADNDIPKPDDVWKDANTIFKPKRIVFNEDNIAVSLYQHGAKGIRDVHKQYQSLLNLKGSEYGYPYVDTSSAMYFRDLINPEIDNYVAMLQQVKHLSTPAAQGIINELIEDARQSKDYYNRLAAGEDVWRTEKSPQYQAEQAEMDRIKSKAQADGTFMKAPNGKPTNLNERQWLQVRTKAFKEWFGDWENDPKNASKVVDENGEPLVVYHDTNRKFTAFDRDYARGSADIEGMYFSDIADPYHEYGDKRFSVFLNIKKPASYDEAYSGFKGSSTDDAGIKQREKLQREGYDGFIATKEDTGLENGELLVFEPTQIKSATDNIGTFDNENDDIRYRKEETPIQNTNNHTIFANESIKEWSDKYDGAKTSGERMEAALNLADALNNNHSKNYNDYKFAVLQDSPRAIAVTEQKTGTRLNRNETNKLIRSAGFYLEGTSYFISDNNATSEDFISTWAHENAHREIEQNYDETFLEKVYDDLKAEGLIKRLPRYYRKDSKSSQAEEIIARTVEDMYRQAYMQGRTLNNQQIERMTKGGGMDFKGALSTIYNNITNQTNENIRPTETNYNRSGDNIAEWNNNTGDISSNGGGEPANRTNGETEGGRGRGIRSIRLNSRSIGEERTVTDKPVYNNQQSLDEFARSTDEYNQNTRFRFVEPEMPEPPKITNKMSVGEVAEQVDNFNREMRKTLREVDEQMKKNSKFIQAAVDRAYPLEKFQQLMEQHGAKLRSETNAYEDLMTSASRATYLIEQYKHEYIRPLQKTLNELLQSGKLDKLTDYYWQIKDATGLIVNNNKIDNYDRISLYLQAKDIVEAENLGLVDRGKTGFMENVKSDEGGETGISPEAYIAEFEKAVGRETINKIWKQVNAANKWSLDMQLKYRIIDKETYNKYTDGSRKYYVPQRGWRERDMLQDRLFYMNDVSDTPNNPYNAALVKAEGRKTLAGDPLAYMESIGESTVLSCLKNETKQTFLQFARENQDFARTYNFFTFKRVYYVKQYNADGTPQRYTEDDGKELSGQIKYERTTIPPSQKQLDHDKEIKEKIGEIVKTRNELLSKEQVRLAISAKQNGGTAKSSPAFQRKIQQLIDEEQQLRDQLDILYSSSEAKIPRERTKAEAKQHEVTVVEDGKEITIIFGTDENGNPVYGGESVANVLNRKFSLEYTSDNDLLVRSEQFLRTGTRFMSRMMTQYNPTFAAANLVRDYGIASISNTVQFGVKYQYEFTKNLGTPKLQQAVWTYAAQEIFSDNKKYHKGYYGQMLHEFFEDGAATGWSFMRDIDQLREDMRKSVDPSTWQKIKESNSNPLTLLKHTFGMLTESSELMTRFAEYLTSREQMNEDGTPKYTRRECAIHAKEVTTNFDRKGNFGKSTNLLFAFFNAAIQGTNKIIRMCRDPRIRTAMTAIMGGYFAGGLLQALFTPDGDDDDRAFTEWELMNNLCVGKIKIPHPQVIRAFWGLGTQAGLAMKGHKAINAALLDGARYFTGNVLPDQLTFWLNLLEIDNRTGELKPLSDKAIKLTAHSVMPTLFQPLYDIFANVKFTGSSVYNTEYTSAQFDTKAERTLGKKNVPSAYQMFSDWMWQMGGGSLKTTTKGQANDITKDVGWMYDWNPSKLQTLVEGYSAGTGKFITDVITLGIDAFDPDKKVNLRQMQIANVFFKQPKEFDRNTQVYFDLKARADYMNEKFRDLKSKDPEHYQKIMENKANPREKKAFELLQQYKVLTNAKEAIENVKNNTAIQPEVKNELLERIKNSTGYADDTQIYQKAQTLLKEFETLRTE